MPRRSNWLCGVVLATLMVPMMGAKQPKPALDELPPWASEPDRVKLDIAQRLVFEKKEYRAAIPLIAAMRKEGVKAPVLDLLQGVAMREEGMFTEAERLLVMAQQRMGGDSRVYEAFCILYADTRRLDEAIANCEKAVKLDSTSASALNNLGFLFLATGRSEEALNQFQLALEQDGSESRYRNNLGLAHVAVGDDKAALAAFASANQAPDALFTMGAAVERYRDADAALPYYRDVLNYDATHKGAVHAIDRITNLDSQTPDQETDQ